MKLLHPSHPAIAGEWDANNNPKVTGETVDGATNYKMLKYQTDNPSDYETISLGDVSTYTDTSVTNGTDTGIWGYELVAENSAGDDIGISAGISFNTVTGEIINDSWHDRMGKLSKADITSYLTSKGIEYSASSTKNDLLELV